MNIRWDLKRFPLRLAVILGDASYSIYMSHWILLYLSNWMAHDLDVDRSIAEPWRFGTLGAICIVSTMLCYGFEKPINQFGHWLSRIKFTATSEREPRPKNCHHPRSFPEVRSTSVRTC